MTEEQIERLNQALGRLDETQKAFEQKRKAADEAAQASRDAWDEYNAARLEFAKACSDISGQPGLLTAI
jgi:hypothetical protein